MDMGNIFLLVAAVVAVVVAPSWEHTERHLGK